MASIYQKRGILYAQLSTDGQKIQVSLKIPDTPENRKRALKEIIPKLEALNERVDIHASKNNLSYYAKVFFDNKQDLKHSTIERYKTESERILKIFGNREVRSIKVSEIKSFLSTLSPASKEANSKVFRGFFDEALQDEAIEKNPFSAIKIRGAKAKDAKPFSIDEMHLLIGSAEGQFKNFLAVAFYSGMRLGEIIALKWDCIDWHNGFIEVRATKRKGIENDTKTSAGNRRIPIFKQLEPFLKNQYHKTGLKNGYVFLTDKGTPYYSYQSIRQSQWVRLLRQCGLPSRRMYDTRSTFATMMLSSGKYSVNQVAKIMGHSNISVLITRYNKFIESEMIKIDRDLGINERATNYQFTTLSTTLEEKETEKSDFIGFA